MTPCGATGHQQAGNVAARDQEQEANARALEREGGAVVLLQSDLTPDTLATTVAYLVGDPDRLATMSEGARKLTTPGAADAIVDELVRLAGQGI